MSRHLRSIANELLWILVIFCITIVSVFGIFQLALDSFTDLNSGIIILLAMLGTIVFGIGFSFALRKLLLRPMEYLSKALLFLAPKSTPVAAPDVSKLLYGKNSTTAMITDLYEVVRQQQSEALHSSAPILAVLNTFSFPIILANAAREISYSNTKAAELFNTTVDQLVGRPLLEVFSPEIQGSNIFEKWLATTKDKLHDGGLWTGVKYVSKQHQTYYFDISATYNRADSSGIEIAIAMLDATLSHEADDVKVDFVAMAAHELRTPITVIRGYMEVFQDEVQQLFNEEQKTIMKKMLVSADHLATFIDNILSASKADQGTLNVVMLRHNWSALIRKIYNDLLIRAQAHDHQLHISIAGGLPDVAVDPFAINEVLTNLVDNAIKYSKEGSTIEIAVRLTNENMVETTVSDQGIGIPSSLVDKLFTKYYRSHRSKDEFGGLGLGLYLCKTIVNAHGGEVSVASNEGKGSVFGFTLPRYEDVQHDLEKHDNLIDITRGSHGWIRNHSLYRR